MHRPFLLYFYLLFHHCLEWVKLVICFIENGAVDLSVLRGWLLVNILFAFSLTKIECREAYMHTEDTALALLT